MLESMHFLSLFLRKNHMILNHILHYYWLDLNNGGNALGCKSLSIDVSIVQTMVLDVEMNYCPNYGLLWICNEW